SRSILIRRRADRFCGRCAVSSRSSEASHRSATATAQVGGSSSAGGPDAMSAPAVEGAAAAAFRSVLARVHQAAERSGRSPEQVRVVAVSKTKPESLVRQVYDAGHRFFGENYVQEIVEKAPQLPVDIEWHFIGNLQRNKVKSLLAGVPNLHMIESVDDEKFGFMLAITLWYCCHAEFYQMDNFPERKVGFLQTKANLNLIANHVDRVVANLGRKPLKVLVQVNTSGEESKFGVDPSGCVNLVRHVKLGCPNLIFSGLMTIGMLDYSSTPENFKTLSNCRAEVCKELEIPEEQCELSMGMSADFEQAIEMGSTNVRIGSTIFGEREYKKKDK
ncbi:Alanine racemase, N-terminal domain, partial [Musa troglodytarum]